MRNNVTEQRRFEQLRDALCKDGKTLCLGQLLEYATHKYPHHIALICDNEQITYEQLFKRASYFSAVLQEAGLKPHDRAILLFENSIEFYIGYFAIAQAGAVVIPLNIYLKEREIDHIIQDAQPRIIIASISFKSLLEKLSVSTPPIFTEKDMPTTGVMAPVIPIESDDMAALLYTSGTTGMPKGVMLSSKNIMTNVAQCLACFELQRDERVFAVLPLFHSFTQNTCVWTSIFVGCTVVILRKIDRRLLLRNLRKYSPTIFLGIPALYGLLCLLKTAPLSHVRIFVSGGDALPDKIRATFALIYGRKICNGYGLTETSPLISIDMADELTISSNVGEPAVGVEVDIRDEEGNSIPNNQIGELWVKGDNVMLGYYRAPELTKKVLVDGWLRTGDLAYIDEKSRIVISGRLKDLIIHKGFNIYPQEIENIIMGNPQVIRVGVIGEQDSEVGEIPIAYVQVLELTENIQKELRQLCRNNLAAYKVPQRFIVQIEDLPTTATGKVNKKVLRATHEK